MLETLGGCTKKGKIATMSGQANADDKRPASTQPPMMHEAFHAMVRKSPHLTGLVDATTGETWSYGEFQTNVLRWAIELRETEGVSLEDVVGIYMEPSPDYVLAMMAILTADAAFTGLELAYPVPMLQNVLVDARAKCVLTKTALKAKPLAASDAIGTAGSMVAPTILCMDDRKLHATRSIDDRETLQKRYEAWTEHATFDNLSFVVYSSGTTGKPKGIANPHRAAALSYEWRFNSLVDYGPGDVVACHVFFIWEALRPLMRGGAVMPLPSDVVFDSERLCENLELRGATEMLFSPSLLENVFIIVPVEELRSKLRKLRTIWLNGEVVSMALRKRCFDFLGPRTGGADDGVNVRVINLYSISECHEVAAVDLVDIDEKFTEKFCPVGEPTTEVYILDEEGKIVPDGDAGELFVAGDMLARGYLHLPELTATRFVDDHFRGSGKMYRTGDRCRMLPNGQLEILGRCDFMVKIRGYSIVLGAVEAALMKAIRLSSCAVFADGEEGEDKYLVAFVIRAASVDQDSDSMNDEGAAKLATWTVDAHTGECPEIRRVVDGLLPHYMVPSVYIEVDSFPVCGQGSKLDRKALQAQLADWRAARQSLHVSAGAGTPNVGNALEKDGAENLRRLVKYLRIPRTSSREDVESTMILLWETVLDRQPHTIRTTSDFHEQGGHSLKAARLAAAVNKAFAGACVTAVDVLHGKVTVAELCDRVLADMKRTSVEATVTVQQKEKPPKETVTAAGHKSESKESADNKRILQCVRDDSRLPDDIVYTQSTSGKVKTIQSAENIFLTGATGFLGSHLLSEILSNSKATVYCLVRNPSPDALKMSFEKFGLPTVNDQLVRAIPVRGDLCKPNFGYDAATWENLISKVEVVVHCGAAVSLSASYAALRPINIEGTLNAIRLATSAKNAGASLAYVSSNGIFSCEAGVKEIFYEDKNDSLSCLPSRLGSRDGYGLTKWAAERLVTTVNRDRGLPTVTVRFGNLGGRTTDPAGSANPLDYQSMILRACSTLKSRPIVSGWGFEATPVDFAAKAFVALASDARTLSEGSLFNCVQDGFTDSDEVFRSAGIMASVPFAAWKAKLEDAVASSDSDDRLTSLFAFVSGLKDVEEYLTTKLYLDCAKFDAAIKVVAPGISRQNFSAAEYYGSFRSDAASLAGVGGEGARGK
eukprot:TRINITY_DN2926_c0_g1_i3.p1 TRINITY_DN2926_c0_g1~~TRINITY_DN2926_c0_g1_i3.p1  ORF type:complete len:1165 (+),score=176.12 TRINITY_DN2926_c0_g1_i3:16-3510(+)